MQISLKFLAHARSGDKGDSANIGLIALREEFYPLLVREVTAERVKNHFAELCKGKVERFELPNLCALNFILHESLGGGGTLSLMTDAQGKTFSTGLLRMEIEIADEQARELGIEIKE
ncbi:MAG: AtuA-related protein [Pyrinomonadaceae bacterium]